MWAMFKKEMRENWAYAAAAFVVATVVLDVYAEGQGWPLLYTNTKQPRPVYQSQLPAHPLPLMAWDTLCVWGAGLIAVKMVYEERWRRTWPLLAQLPASREGIVSGKFLAGLAIYGVIMLAAAGLMVARLATPGAWPGPFMLGDCWALAIPLTGGMCAYCLTFLSAQRQARWYATKWLPLALAVAVWILSARSAGYYVQAGTLGGLFTYEFGGGMLGTTLGLLWVAGLLAASVLAVFGIRGQARTREY